MSLPWNSAFLRLLSWLLHVSHSTPLPKKRVNLQLSFCLVLTSSSPVSHSSNGKHLPNKHKQNRARNEKYLLFEKVSFVFLLTHKHLVFTITGITTFLYWYATAVLQVYYTYRWGCLCGCMCVFVHTHCHSPAGSCPAAWSRPETGLLMGSCSVPGWDLEQYFSNIIHALWQSVESFGYKTRATFLSILKPPQFG